MTARELIKALKRMPPDRDVAFQDFDADADRLHGVIRDAIKVEGDEHFNEGTLSNIGTILMT